MRKQDYPLLTMGSLRTSQRDTGFDPRNVPGCALWLDGADASTLTLSGSSVSQWNDKSGNAYHATQSSSANRPVYTGSNIKFTSANQMWMDLNQSFGNRFLNNTAFNVFIVAFGGGSGFITGQVANTSQNLFLGYGFIDTYQTPWYLQGSASVPDTVNSINGFEYTGSVGTLYQNASSFATATKTLSLTSFTGPQIGRRFGGAGGGAVYHDHTFCEIIAYIGVVLTANQRQQVEGYLAWKWGLIPRFQNPLSISGCALWLDAADTNTVVTSGSNVTQWRDKSGIGNHITSTSGTSTYTSNAINGTPAILMGSSYFTGSFATTYTGTSIRAFAVATMNNASGNAYGRILSVGRPGASDYADPTSLLPLTRAGGQNIGIWRNSASAFVNVPAYDTPFLVRSANVGSNISIAINGGSDSTVSAGTSVGFNITHYCVGANVQGPTVELYGGYIGEIIYYTSALTTAQIQQVEGYLADKWGLRSNLPAGFPAMIPVSHPFYRSVPSTRLITPLDVAGCTLWLDAADGTSMVLSGTNVTQWNDKSGNNRHATQSTTSLQPTYVSSSNCIRFAGASYLNMADAFNMLSSSGRYYTAFVVEKRGAVGGAFPINGGGTGGSCLIMGYTGDTVWRHTTVAIVDLDYTVPGWQNPDPVRLWSGAYSGSIRDTYMNGTLGVSQSFSTTLNGWTEAMIGYLRVYDVNVYYSGDIYEMLFFNSYLSVADRQRIEGYLAWKWGLVGNIPTAHPHKSLPPFVSMFTPSQISGLICWLDAADSSVFNTSATWTDKSGTGNHGITGTPGSTTMPTITTWSNGLNAARFVKTSNNSLKTINAIPNLNVTYFLMLRIQDVVATGTQIMINNLDGQRQIQIAPSSSFPVQIVAYGSGTSASVALTTVNQSVPFQICVSVASGASGFNGYTNGTLSGTTVTNNSAASNHYFAGSVSVDIAEILIYNTVLNVAQRRQVEGYLADKWGVRSSLPSTHPYIKERA